MTTKELIEHLDRSPNIKLYFYNPECKYCKELTTIVTNTPGLHKVNTYNENEEVSDMFDVEYVPALAIVKETLEGLDYDLYEGPDEIKEYLM